MASVTLTACGGGGAVSGGGGAVSGGGVASVNNELLTAASATPGVQTNLQAAASNDPLYGSVSQLSYGTRTFEVIPFIHKGELSYKTKRNNINPDTGAVYDPRSYDLKFYPDYRGSDTFSTTRFAKDGAFHHVGLKYEYADERHNGEDSGTAYIDVFTDYELPTAASSTTFTRGDLIPGVYSTLTTPNAGIHSQPYDLNGVAGMMSCEGQCILAEGRVGGNGNYIFTPDDADYLVGGIWLWAPDSEANRASTWIGVSASGNDPFGDENGMGIAAVTGSATYSGRAHGIRGSSFDEGSDSVSVAVAFDADVALTAEFGDDNTGGMISGRVSDFESSDAEFNFDGTDDTINLKPAPISGINSGFFTGSTDHVQVSVNEDGTTDIDPIENVGKWGGQFYGNGEEQPGSVAGTFGVTHGGSQPDDSTVSFLGVFGAYKVASVNNEFLTAASATPGVQTNLQAAASNDPLYGSVSQLSYGTRTFEVIPFIDNDGELSYKTERKRKNQDTGAVFDYTRYYDLKLFPDYRGPDTVSTTRFAKDGAFRHVGLKYEFADEPHNGEHSQTAYIDVFTDYDLTEAGGDADYLVGGIWLWTPIPDGTRGGIVGVSASGNDPFGDAASGMGIAAVTGSATYSGRAHGISGSSFDEGSGSVSVAAAFDADVALTAEFGDDSTGGMISGRVFNLEVSDRPKCEVDCGNGGDLAIILKAAPIGDINSGFFTGSTDSVVSSVSSDGTTEIDTTENVGKWGGQFYGNGEEQPGSVAGTFGVTVGGSQPDDSTVSLLGIFGAHKDDE